MDTHNAYQMEHWSIVAPSVDNDGMPSNYARRLRAHLAGAGITGWTEHDSLGFWQGKPEAGTVFTLYLSTPTAHGYGWRSLLMNRARIAMPGQEAVQVVFHGTVTLYEA